MAIISQSIVGGELYRDRVLRDGAVGYWRLGDAVGSGTVVDIAGGHTGTVVGGVTLGQAGAIADGDGAALFDGSSGYVDCGNVFNPGLSDFSIECSFKTSSNDNDFPLVSKSAYSSALNRWALTYNSGGLSAFLATGAGTATATWTTTTVCDNLWHHVVAAYKRSGQCVLYVDGVSRASADISASAAVNVQSVFSLLFGRYNNIAGTGPVAGSLALNGCLDDVSLCVGSALTPQQVAAHYGLRLAAVHGGLVMGGAATIRRGVNVTPTGGLVMGGSATVTRGVSMVGSGGMVIGGHGWPWTTPRGQVVNAAASTRTHSLSASTRTHDLTASTRTYNLEASQ